MNAKQKQWKNGARLGFTLTEVMISMLLLAISAAGIFGLANALQTMNRLSDRVSDATLLTGSKIEDLRRQDYASLASSNDTVSIYTRTWTVATNAAALHKNVIVRTSWTDRQGDKNVAIVAAFVE